MIARAPLAHAYARTPDRTEGFLVITLWTLLSWHWLTGFKLIPWDAFDEFYPVAYYVAQAVHAGEWPWWNNYQYSGTPLFADPQSLLFTAFTVVGGVLGPRFSPTVFNWIELLHVLAGGLALLAYLRMGASPPLRRLIAVCIYMFGGVATSRLQHVPQIVTYGYLPILLWLGFRVIRCPSWRTALSLGFVVWLICSNPNQLTLLGGIAVAVLWLVHLSSAPARAALRALGYMGVAGVLGVCASLPMLAAVIEFAALSNRSVLSVADSAPASLPGFTFVAAAIPSAFGLGGFVSDRWMPNDITEDWLYVGAPALVLLVAGVGSIRSRVPATLVILVFAYAAFAMGVHTWFYPWIFEHVPGFNLFRRPSDGAYVLVLLVSLLVASLRDPSIDRCSWQVLLSIVLLPLIVITLVAFSSDLLLFVQRRQMDVFFYRAYGVGVIRYAVVAGLFLWMYTKALGRASGARYWAIAGTVVTAVDIVSPVRFGEFTGASRSWEVGRYYRHQIDRSATKDIARVVAFLANNGVRGPAASYRFEATSGPLSSGFASFAQVSSTQGYAPIRLRSYHEKVGSVAAAAAPTFGGAAKDYSSVWFRAIGLKFVFLPTGARTIGVGASTAETQMHRAYLAASAAGEQVFSSQAGYDIWQLPNSFPAARLVAHGALSAGLPSGHEDALGNCSAVHRTASTMETRCHVVAPAHVVFTEIAHPGWYACVDGVSRDVVTAWGLVRAVALDPGDHVVRMIFEPSPLLRLRSC